MRLLSLHEPWATLMALQYKRVETRDWQTSYRGPLAIHASKHGMSLENTLDTCLETPFYNALMTYPPFRDRMIHYRAAPRSEDINKRVMKEVFPDRGKIVAIVDLKNCWRTEDFDKRHPGVLTTTERSFGNYEPLRFGWLTELIFRLPEPVAFTSKQGLVDVPQDVRDELKRQWRKNQEDL